MSTAILDYAALKAALFAVSNEETRYYLNGVLVEIGPRTVTYVATDGHIMFAHHAIIPGEPVEPELIGNFIIPSDAIKAIKLAKRDSPIITLRGEADGAGMRLEYDGGRSIGFNPIDATFPNWRRVLPETTDGTLPSGVSFNPNLLAKLWKAGEVMGWTMPPIRYNGTGPALLSYGSQGDTIGVIMPMRNDAGNNAAPLPLWAQFREHEAQAIAA